MWIGMGRVSGYGEDKEDKTAKSLFFIIRKFTTSTPNFKNQQVKLQHVFYCHEDKCQVIF